MARAELPGKIEVERNAEAVYQKKIAVRAFDVRAVKVWYTCGKLDFAVLESQGYTNDHWVTLELTSKINIGDIVDVVGYPGSFDDTRLLRTHSSLSNKTIEQEFENARRLLPSGKLAVTNGVVTTDGESPTLRASTTHGMSGAPVVRHGKVIGM